MRIVNGRSLVVSGLFGIAAICLAGLGCGSNSTSGGGSGGSQSGNGGTQSGNGGSQSGNGGSESGNGGSQSGNGGSQSGNGGSSSGNGGSSSGNGGSSSGNGGSSSGSGGAAGSSAGGDVECTGKAPSADLITDFSDATGSSTITLSNGGIFIYPATGGPVPAIADGALHVTADVAASSYWGFGIYFADCTDASAYSGVKFNLKGTTDCPMKFGANLSVDDNTSGAGKQGCTATACYGPNSVIAASDITSDGKDITVTFDGQAGGAPVTTIGSHKSALTGIGWQFASTAACKADVTVDNVSFVK